MSKDDSMMAKGAAILLMVFLHLFNSLNNCALCSPLLMLGDVPLVHVITRACNPVAFFMLLSGVGLYSSYRIKGRITNGKRLLKLYIHFWVILTIFLIVGHLIDPERYPGSWLKLIRNYSSLYYTYNAEYWFLLPYALLALTSPVLFRICDKMNYWIPLVGSFIIELGAGFLISRFGNRYLYGNMLFYMPVLYMHLLFWFVLGMTCVRANFWGLLDKLRGRNGFLLWGAFFAVIALRCVPPLGMLHAVYVVAFVILFVAAPKAPVVSSLFMSLGRHSMNMWLIHTWFCYYLFKDFIYGFKYPLVIYIVLLAISMLVSIAINYIVKPITQRI